MAQLSIFYAVWESRGRADRLAVLMPVGDIFACLSERAGADELGDWGKDPTGQRLWLHRCVCQKGHAMCGCGFSLNRDHAF